MRTVTVVDNKIVVEVDGAKVRYPLEIVRKRISSLLQDLETWHEYERLLTQRPADGAYTCPHNIHPMLGRCALCFKDDGTPRR